MTKQKTCKKCGETKDVSFFGPQKRMKDGLRSECKPCFNEYMRGVRRKKLEYFREKDRERFKKEERRKKVYAYAVVKYAKKAGRLKMMPCVVCGEEKTQGHHFDYKKPDHVIWLCPTHHAEVHSGKISLDSYQKT